MTILNRALVPNGYPNDLHRPESCLVILCPSDQNMPPWVKELKERRIRALDKSFHYLKLSQGLSEQQRPYVLVEGLQVDRQALEKRWVFQSVMKHIKSHWNCSSLLIAHENFEYPLLAKVLAEDAYHLAAHPVSPGNDWQEFKLISNKEDFKLTQDPYQDIRFAGLSRYRHWINENPDSLTSVEIGIRLKQFAQEQGCEFRELLPDELKREGLNLLLAVGQGASQSPSRLFILGSRLKPGKRPLMLIGKGITFDTGGINLKPFESHVNAMKNDMGGAALMANLFMSLVQSGFEDPLVLVIPSCENAIDALAMKPGVVVKSHFGHEVFIEHTDAEGRLILADAMSFAQQIYQPKLTIMAATLTTASLRQYTQFFTGVHFASSAFQEALAEKGRSWGENFSFWGDFLPFQQANTSKAADLTNMGRLPLHAHIGGGSSVAAHFLREFTRGPFIHFDIFNSCWNWGGDYPGSLHGATGAPFNSLYSCLRDSAATWAKE